MQAYMDKRGMVEILVQGDIHPTPKERKPDGVLLLSHH